MGCLVGGLWDILSGDLPKIPNEVPEAEPKTFPLEPLCEKRKIHGRPHEKKIKNKKNFITKE